MYIPLEHKTIEYSIHSPFVSLDFYLLKIGLVSFRMFFVDKISVSVTAKIEILEKMSGWRNDFSGVFFYRIFGVRVCIFSAITQCYLVLKIVCIK